MATATTTFTTSGQSATTTFSTTEEPGGPIGDGFVVSDFQTAHAPPPLATGAYPNPAPPSNESNLRVFYGDLGTGELWGELAPIGATTWTRTLNAAGSASIPIALDVELADEFQWRRTAVWIEEDGELVKGIIAEALTGVDLAQNRGTLTGPGIYSFMSHQHVDHTFDYFDRPSEIARGVLAGPAADIRLEIADDNSTFPGKVARNTEAAKFESVAKVVADLVTEAKGFDFIDRYRRDPDGPTAIWQPVRKNGQTRSTVFHIGANVEHAGGEIDATSLVDEAIAVGASNDDDTPHIRVNGNSTAAVRFEARTSHSDTSDTNVLRERANLELARGRNVTIRPSVRIHPGALPVGSWELGDLIDLRGGYGIYQPEGRYRIIETSATADKGQTLTTATLAPAEVFDD